MSVRQRSSGFALVTAAALLLSGFLASTSSATVADRTDGVAAPPVATGAVAVPRDRFEELMAQWRRSGVRPAGLHVVRPVAVRKPAPTVQAHRSGRADVVVPPPKLYNYYDNGRIRWVVKAKWRWRNTHWRDGCNDICSRAEGFAIRWTPVLDATSSTLRKCTRADDKYPGCWYQTTPKEKNFHGLGYIVHGQVRVHWAPSPMHVDWMRYLGHHGSLVIHIRKPPCGTKFHLISGYSHVWRSSKVTGFSISTGGFGISWSDETHAWEMDSYTGVYRRAC